MENLEIGILNHSNHPEEKNKNSQEIFQEKKENLKERYEIVVKMLPDGKNGSAIPIKEMIEIFELEVDKNIKPEERNDKIYEMVARRDFGNRIPDPTNFILSISKVEENK